MTFCGLFRGLSEIGKRQSGAGPRSRRVFLGCNEWHATKALEKTSSVLCSPWCLPPPVASAAAALTLPRRLHRCIHQPPASIASAFTTAFISVVLDCAVYRAGVRVEVVI